MIIKEFTNPPFRKILLEGSPKDSGKTTFALSAGVFGSVLDLQFDYGHPTVPPGVPHENITVKIYPPSEPDIKADSSKWKHDKTVGGEMIRDIQEIRSAFREQRPIKLNDSEIALPKTLVLDGAPTLADSVLQWLLGVNNAFDADDFGIGKTGKSNRYALWGQRLSKLQYLYSMLIPLPCNVILITWLTPETVGRGDETVQTGNFLPDIGGKLDIQGAGKFDSTLRLYSVKGTDKTRYFASASGGDKYPGLGIRGKYEWQGWNQGAIEVTIEPGKPLPYERVFGAF